MAFCPNCGSSLPEGSNHCPNCGAPVTPAPTDQAGGTSYQQQNPFDPAYNQQQNSFDSAYNQQPYGQLNQPYARETVPMVPTGGLMAWAIITLLLCTIPGIVALVKVNGINKCMTVEEQQQKIKSAKTWCTVGTILGVLAVIGQIASNVSGLML